MMICPRCEGLIRNGDRVRASVLGTFFRDDSVGHSLTDLDEEWVEHSICEPEPWEVKLVKYLRRKWRWLRGSIFPARWGV